MAAKAQNGKQQKSTVEGTMDITEHLKTWHGFWAGVKWSSGGVLAVLVLLAIFRTN